MDWLSYILLLYLCYRKKSNLTWLVDLLIFQNYLDNLLDKRKSTYCLLLLNHDQLKFQKGHFEFVTFYYFHRRRIMSCDFFTNNCLLLNLFISFKHILIYSYFFCLLLSTRPCQSSEMKRF